MQSPLLDPYKTLYAHTASETQAIPIKIKSNYILLNISFIYVLFSCLVHGLISFWHHIYGLTHSAPISNANKNKQIEKKYARKPFQMTKSAVSNLHRILFNFPGIRSHVYRQKAYAYTFQSIVCSS